MKRLFLHTVLLSSLGLADSINDTPSVSINATASTSAKTSLSLMIGNEKSIASLHPYEKNDLTTIEAVNKTKMLTLIKTSNHLTNLCDQKSIGAKISFKKGEINLLNAEEESIIAQTDKTN